MEGFIFICKRKLNIAVERTKELTFFHESLLTVTREHVIKMNVVLIKGCIHIYSQTENAFSVDREWACESNTIQQYKPSTKCLHAGGSQLDNWTNNSQ